MSPRDFAMKVLVSTMLRIAFLLALAQCSFAAAVPGPERPLATLRPAHPRLIATETDFNRVRDLVRSDPIAASFVCNSQAPSG
ncbi:MAG TPA: hypothetical protein VOA41_12105 [Candidatus Dormibacteraeota bacterium]|nr:hypothetical protein [Candidatus Dormibacteraeota bacterium]